MDVAEKIPNPREERLRSSSGKLVSPICCERTRCLRMGQRHVCSQIVQIRWMNKEALLSLNGRGKVFSRFLDSSFILLQSHFLPIPFPNSLSAGRLVAWMDRRPTGRSVGRSTMWMASLGCLFRCGSKSRGKLSTHSAVGAAAASVDQGDRQQKVEVSMSPSNNVQQLLHLTGKTARFQLTSELTISSCSAITARPSVRPLDA